MDDPKIRQWISEACVKNNEPHLATQIYYTFNGRLTRAFGQAYFDKMIIEFSSSLWDRATEQQKKECVIHETCHLIADKKYGSRDHSNPWKIASRVAGIEPNVYHDVDRSGLVRSYPKYEAQCGCTKKFIGHVISAKIRKGDVYVCEQCSEKVVLTGKSIKGDK